MATIRQLRRIALGALLTSALFASAAARAETPTDLGTRRHGVDWPCFLGSTHDSKSPETGLDLDWSDAPPPVVWQVTLGTGYGAPVVSRGRLFQFDRAENQARLRVFRSETGELLWQFAYASDYEDLYGYENGPRASPLVDDERVYLFGAEGMLHCLAVEDGRVLWKLDTNQRFGVVQNFFGVGSSPLVEGELLIVPVGGSPAESQRVPPGQLDRVLPNGTGIVAFDKRSGEVRYALGDELASYASPVPATIGGRRWCFWFARGGLLGFDPTNGKIDFHFPWRADSLESVNASNPVVVDDLVFISETYGPGSALVRAQPGASEVVWSDAANRRQKAMQTHWNTAVHHRGYLYGSSGRHTNNAELRAVELATGKVQWSVPDLGRASLLYVDEHFVALSELGELLVFRAQPERFELVSRVVLRRSGANEEVFGPAQLIEYPAWAAPVLSHGLLYVRGRGRLACLELKPN